MTYEELRDSIAREIRDTWAYHYGNFVSAEQAADAILSKVAEAVKAIEVLQREIPNNTSLSAYEKGKYAGAIDFRQAVLSLLTKEQK